MHGGLQLLEPEAGIQFQTVFTDAEECFDEHDHDSGQCSGVSVD